MTRSTRWRGSDAGLALSEVLMIVLVIGTLAAVAIPLYLGHPKAAKDAAAEADALDLGVLLWLDFDSGDGVDSVTSNGDWYFFDGEAALETSPGVEVSYFEGGSAESWCLELRHPAGEKANDPGVRLRAGEDEVEFARCPVPSRAA